jgi:hypothetical protein
MKYGFSCSLMATALIAFLCWTPAWAAQQPRLADGHPNLSGTWHTTSGHVTAQPGVAIGEKRSDGSRIATYAQRGAEERPATGRQPQQPRPRPSTPAYKPELVAKVKDLEANQNKADTTFVCHPPGLPRVGPPHKIVHGVGEIAIVYSDLTGNFWRIVPTDGRPHNEDFDPSFFGDSVGHWEGDTLVIDVTNFNDETWLSDFGTFHSKALHVTERLRREGDTLHYDVTVEDPNVLAKPWTMDTRVLKLSDEPIEEAPFCKDQDQPHVVNQDHHGENR